MRALEPLWAGLATAGFALVFELRGKDLPLAAAGGALGWAVAAPMIAAGASQAAAYFAASALIGVWAEILALVRKRPATIYIVCSIIPLVPGGGMYSMMLEYVKGNAWGSFFVGLDTLQAAGAIAAGLAVSVSISRLFSLRSIAKRLGGPGRGGALMP